MNLARKVTGLGCNFEMKVHNGIRVLESSIDNHIAKSDLKQMVL